MIGPFRATGAAILNRPLFVFGSMLDDDILGAVLGRELPPSGRTPARLHGFRCLRVPDESYPFLAPSPHAAVDGELLSDLTERDFDRIRFFESEEYTLRDCTVVVAGARTLRACHFADATVMAGATEAWSLDRWQRDHKAAFLCVTRDYMQLYGRAGVAEAEAYYEELLIRHGAGSHGRKNTA